MVIQGYFGAYVALDGLVLIGANRGHNRGNHVWSSYRTADGQWSNLVEVTPPADDRTVGANFSQPGHRFDRGDRIPGGPQASVECIVTFGRTMLAWTVADRLEDRMAMISGLLYNLEMMSSSSALRG